MKKILLKSILALTSLALFSTISCSSGDDSSSSPISTTPTTTPTVDVSTLETLSSVNFAKQLVIGWNLGNTLDAHSTGKTNNPNTETSWISVKTTKAMIDTVAKKGFKTIRIPVSWHNHITDSDYKIDSTWMNRVKEVVDWAISNDMFVILNVHHDDLTASEANDTYGYNILATDKTESKKYLKNVWTQIASTFKDYDLRLVFEVLNEPRAIDEPYEWWEDDPKTNISSVNSTIEEFEQLCVNTIRSTAGNNSKRFLMVPTYAANCQLDKNWSMPNDSTKDKLLLSAHAYVPDKFALNGSQTTYDDSVANSIDYVFNYLNTNYISKGIGCVMGEASCSNKNNDSERLKWIEKYFSTAKSKGVPVILWDNMTPYDASKSSNGEFHDWFNRSNLTWYHESLVDKMISCSK